VEAGREQFAAARRTENEADVPGDLQENGTVLHAPISGQLNESADHLISSVVSFPFSVQIPLNVMRVNRRTVEKEWITFPISLFIHGFHP
jgi:hypothetical protein